MKRLKNNMPISTKKGGKSSICGKRMKYYLEEV